MYNRGMRKVAIGIAAVLALVLFCYGATVAFGNSGPKARSPVTTQLDTRPSSLMVQVGGNGVSSTDSSAALQSPGQVTSLSAPGSTQAKLMGQTGGVSLQADIGDITSGLTRAVDQLAPPPGYQLDVNVNLP